MDWFLASFQSRCRDWVVGEALPPQNLFKDSGPVSVSLPRLGGWRDDGPATVVSLTPRFSLVAEIGWLARKVLIILDILTAMFQSRCRDWVVGEN